MEGHDDHQSQRARGEHSVIIEHTCKLPDSEVVSLARRFQFDFNLMDMPPLNSSIHIERNKFHARCLQNIDVSHRAEIDSNQTDWRLVDFDYPRLRWVRIRDKHIRYQVKTCLHCHFSVQRLYGRGLRCYQHPIPACVEVCGAHPAGKLSAHTNAPIVGRAFWCTMEARSPPRVLRYLNNFSNLRLPTTSFLSQCLGPSSFGTH